MPDVRIHNPELSPEYRTLIRQEVKAKMLDFAKDDAARIDVTSTHPKFDYQPGFIPPLRLHHFPTTGEAYDESQTDPAIRHGDILVIKPEKVIGILHHAWPVAITKAGGEFHRYTMEAFAQSDFPRDAFRRAQILARVRGWI